MNRDDQPAVGILDSGVGGLTVAKEVLRQLGGERIIYFGTRADVPTARGREKRYSALRWKSSGFWSNFPSRPWSSLATRPQLWPSTRSEADVRTGAGGDRTRCPRGDPIDCQGRIGVIGTQGTVRSGAYEKALKRLDPGLFVVSHACPALVPLVESDCGGRQRPVRWWKPRWHL